jgi:hypothetical protein
MTSTLPASARRGIAKFSEEFWLPPNPRSCAAYYSQNRTHNLLQNNLLLRRRARKRALLLCANISIRDVPPTQTVERHATVQSLIRQQVGCSGDPRELDVGRTAEKPGKPLDFAMGASLSGNRRQRTKPSPKITSCSLKRAFPSGPFLLRWKPPEPQPARRPRRDRRATQKKRNVLDSRAPPRLSVIRRQPKPSPNIYLLLPHKGLPSRPLFFAPNQPKLAIILICIM